MRLNYGPNYTEAHKSVRTVKPTWSVKKLRHSWLVYEIHSGDMYMTIPIQLKYPHSAKLRAYYVASRLNGKVTDVFNFGTDFFGRQD